MNRCDKTGKEQSKTKPRWQRRPVKVVEDWRKDLSRIEEIRRRVEIKKPIKDRLERKIQLVHRGTMAVSVS